MTNRTYEQTPEQALKRLKKWYKNSSIPYTGLRRSKETYDAEMGLNAAGMAIDALEREIKANRHALENELDDRYNKQSGLTSLSLTMLCITSACFVIGLGIVGMGAGL